MATKPKAGPKKAATKKAAPKQAANLFNQPAAKPSAAKSSPSKPKPQSVKVNTAPRNLPALRTSTLPAAKAKVPAAKPVAKSLATRLGSSFKGKGKIGLLGGMLAAGTAAAYSAYNRGTGTTKKKAAETPSKGAAPVSIIKDYNRRDTVKKDIVGKPLTPTVLNKPAAKSDTPKVGAGAKASTPSKGGAKSKGKSSATPKKQAPIALAKGIGAKDIKLSSASSVGKPEVKSVNYSKPSVSSEKPEYSKVQIARMETRAERKDDRKDAKAERKSERMENRAERLEKRAGKLKSKLKYGGSMKAKNGKSFPDLNKDGKITKADILKGRGVIAKKGASIRKAGLGDILGKVAGSGAFGLAGMAANKLFGGKKKAAPAMGGAPMGAPAAVPAVAPMKKGGKISAKKKMMKSGGKMAKCKYGCK